MYAPLKRFAAGILRVSLEAPQPPAGTVESTVVFRASPRYLTYRLIPFWLGVAGELVAFLPAAVVAGLKGSTWGIVLMALGAMVVGIAMFLGYCAVRLDYELRYYVVTDRSIRIREGAWTVREMTLTHANVQDVSIAQGPLQRFLGIADVVVKTAGGGAAVAQPGGQGHLAMLAGVEDAPGVRDRIRAFQKHRADDGLGDVAPARARAAARAPTSSAVVEALREVAGAARALRSVAEARGA